MNKFNFKKTIPYFSAIVIFIRNYTRVPEPFAGRTTIEARRYYQA